MVFKSIIGATCACLAVVSFSADAALVGRLAATPGGTDYQAYYDDVADLTWLADANYAMTSGYDADGFLNWADANAWAAGLNVGGVDGWRLPSSLNADGTGPCSGSNCTDSEMGNLFYNVLGGSAGISIGTIHNDNYDLFSNVLDNIYWSATIVDPSCTDPYGCFAWTFASYIMTQGYDPLINTWASWAVQSGDVSAVPAPAAIWLFGSGLIGLIGFARRKTLS